VSGLVFLSFPFKRTISTDKTRTGGQIKNTDDADDVRNVDLTKVHYLSGPFEVEGAKPGDVLLVEIMDVQPFQDQPWGFTGIFDKSNGVCLSSPLRPIGEADEYVVLGWLPR